MPEEELSTKEKTKEIDDVIQLLPEQYRTILFLREHHEFSYEQLAQTLEMSVDQVKVTLYRARQRFMQISERIGKDF
ncbi:sigma-70 family RNA polymerase sigma factor [Gracilibacillus massiliensis]|uniref:sigma-70 family RNA polymerase sigma factor n=1 Tax=Gracilibacillus massiliensis TaxID=1564956 RepID=UPI0009E99D67